MSDNIKRGLRTMLQTTLGMIAAGALAQVWNTYLDTHNQVDPTVTVAVGLLLTMFAAWAQNAIEDKTGSGILVPSDRIAGNVVLGSGVGEKMVRDGKALPAEVEQRLAGPASIATAAGLPNEGLGDHYPL